MAEQRVLLLDLENDPALIERYKAWHRPGAVPSEVLASIRDAGVLAMDIHQVGDRLVMIMTVDGRYSPEAKARSDAANPAVQAWEARMSQFQKPLPFAPPGVKWLEAERIFRLDEH